MPTVPLRGIKEWVETVPPSKIAACVVLAVLILASISWGLAQASGSHWEDWERYSVELHRDQEYKRRGGMPTTTGTTGMEISVPDGFIQFFERKVAAGFRVDANNSDATSANTNIYRISISTIQYSDIERTQAGDRRTIGIRDYSGYVGVGQGGADNMLGMAIYLAGGQWWRLTVSTDSMEWTDEDQQIFENVMDSIDHG